MPASLAYAQLAERARAALTGRRDVSDLSTSDIELGRLFAYAYRNQTIGAFHATREALERLAGAAAVEPARARLRDLQAVAMRDVPRDFRAVAPVLASYDIWCDEVLEALAAPGTPPAIAPIRKQFAAVIERIRRSEGIVPARDDELPPQASYQVPGIEVLIVPLVYGDHISWNTAYLTAESAGATTHRHAKQAEIHLGYHELRGRTLLDGHAALVHQGYAMPIPALRDHGFDNLSGHEHFVPFIFGSLELDGWGVFFDVEPRPADTASWPHVPLQSEAMNRSIELEPALARVRREPAGARHVLVPAVRTARPATGGLELAAYRVGSRPVTVDAPQFRILSVYAGEIRLAFETASADLGPHQHVGVPANMPATLARTGPADAVVLEASLHPA